MIPKLETLRETVEQCRGCLLAQTRNKVVFGVGIPTAKVMLIGEGPGANEDAQGEPFVGRAGILLDKMLLAAGFSRKENIYIANMVKCRPPQNRDPAPEEVAACIGYLREQIALVKPRIIVCLGRVAAQAMINPSFRVTKEHGTFVEKDGILYMGTFHPAALLRFPANKPEAFADLLAMREKLAELSGKRG
jgi:DNA polymerase